ncbi:hypothetical protein Vretimale_17303, partial [Volvox reticuliferus]
MIETQIKSFSKAANASFQRRPLKDSGRPDICRREHRVIGPRMLGAHATVATSPEVTEKSIHGLSTGPYDATRVVGDGEIFSTQALVADYQYALRYYRAVKRQVGAWQSAFTSTKGRHPTVEDAADHGGSQFALLYSSFLEVRTRLLVELPRLRERMLCGQDMDKDAQHAKPGGDRGSVNANSSAPGLVSVPQGGGRDSPIPTSEGAKHPQVVDSVSTWLLADRYRRQRAVAAAAILDTGPWAAAPQKALDAPAPHSAGQEEEMAGPRLQQHLPAAAVKATRFSSNDAAWVPYRPTIQLTPLSQRLPAASMEPQRHVHGQIQDGISVPSLPTLAYGEELCFQVDNVDGQRNPALAPQRLATSLDSPPNDSAAHGEAWHEQGSTDVAVPEGSGQEGGALAEVHLIRGAGGSTEALQHGAAPSGHVARLAEDASLAADSRARNALLAALQYKRGGPSAASMSRRGTNAGGHRDDAEGHPGALRGSTPADSGDGAAAIRDHGSSVVVGEVHRGDAVGVYGGRNRLADT